MNNQSNLPKMISVVAIVLGCIDLVRGTMHTVFLEYAAGTIAGLNLSLPNAVDQLQLMAAFGASNFITGGALIMTGLYFRKGAHFLLGIIPASYMITIFSLRYYRTAYEATQANWGGAPMMRIYLVLCLFTFMYGLYWRTQSASEVGEISGRPVS